MLNNPSHGRWTTTATWPWRPRAVARLNSERAGRTCRKRAGRTAEAIYARHEDRAVVRRAVALVGWRSSDSCDAKRAAKAHSLSKARGVRLALAEVADLFHLLEYERDLHRPANCALGANRRPDRLDVPLRLSDGVALGRQVWSTAEADIPQPAAVAQTRLSLIRGRNAAANGQRGADCVATDYRRRTFPSDCPAATAPTSCRRVTICRPQPKWASHAATGSVHCSAAKGGIASNSIKGLTSANPWAWDALGSLTLPVFNFGRLRRAEQAAMERYTQSALTYEQTVLTAFSDVEQALVAIATYRRQTERYGELVLANDRIAAMTQALYRSGLSDYLDVIDAQRSLYQSQMEFVNLVAQQYINYVNLCKALGGGW
ncbi:MAG: TolC family protein [Alistipes finegoldii]